MTTDLLDRLQYRLGLVNASATDVELIRALDIIAVILGDIERRLARVAPATTK